MTVTSNAPNCCSTIHKGGTVFGGYWLNGQFYPTSPWSAPAAPIHYVQPWFATLPDNKKEKAFHVAKSLIASKRVGVASPEEFIALVEELAAVL